MRRIAGISLVCLALSLVAACGTSRPETGSLLPTLSGQDLSRSPTGNESTASMTPSPRPTGTPRLPATPEPTAPPADTSTPNPTQTQTPTPAATATDAPSPTPDRVLPGFYLTGGCATTKTVLWVDLKFCVQNVTVTEDRKMVVAVDWTMTGIPALRKVFKQSDQTNRKMYLIDNLGNRYDHFSGGGAAYSRVEMENGVTQPGTFEFGAPPPGAFRFTFYDDDQKYSIPIALTDRLILYRDLRLTFYPIIMEYPDADFDLVEIEAGGSQLVHKELPGCTLAETPPGEPQGSLKNTTDIGKITYQIYGYTDPESGLSVREYLAVAGIPGLDPDILPLFRMTIADENSLQCIFDASEALARLSVEEQAM